MSAGRVQSVAMRIICESERAIQAFEPQEYWSITAHLNAEAPPPFAAKLAKKDGKKIKKEMEKILPLMMKVLNLKKVTAQRILKKQNRRIRKVSESSASSVNRSTFRK